MNPQLIFLIIHSNQRASTPETPETPSLVVMSFNQVPKKVCVGTLQEDGKAIVLSVATSTSKWDRREEMAKKQESAFKAAVQNSLDVVSNDTKEICSKQVTHYSGIHPHLSTGPQATQEWRRSGGRDIYCQRASL